MINFEENIMSLLRKMNKDRLFQHKKEHILESIKYLCWNYDYFVEGSFEILRRNLVTLSLRERKSKKKLFHHIKTINFVRTFLKLLNKFAKEVIRLQNCEKTT